MKLPRAATSRGTRIQSLCCFEPSIFSIGLWAHPAGDGGGQIGAQLKTRFQEQGWINLTELYNIAEDFSEYNDLAAKNPGRDHQRGAY
jgi:hypothetical protein